ncbi:MAG: response regulator transcription factor [Alicyclobacillaceae bacterium]|nr:response regulator transcription factor [Alicyclobacillaceae bacterium]
MRQIRVLVVEHQSRFRQGLRSILELEKELEPVGEARNAQEFLDVMGKVPADVVLLDLGAVGERSADLVHTVKTRWPSARVLVLSEDAGQTVVDVLCAGADGVVLKDAGVQGLVDAIRSLIRIGAYLHPKAAKQLIDVLRHLRANLRTEKVGVAFPGAQPAAGEQAAVQGMIVAEGIWERAGFREEALAETGVRPPAGGKASAGGRTRRPPRADGPGAMDRPCSRPGVLAPLTRREFEVLQLLAEGRSNRDIAKKLFVSEKTVKNHVASILDKLLVRDRTQAVLVALKHGWVKLT